jgi:hypothetical protein
VTTPSSTTSLSTFVVRFWREWTATGPRWRGHVEHVQSGESTGFLDLRGLVRFIRELGVMANEECRAHSVENSKVI